MFVTVLDVNDNRPIFLQSSYEASVPEDIPEGHSIVQVGGGWGRPRPVRDGNGRAWLLLQAWPELGGKGDPGLPSLPFRGE